MDAKTKSKALIIGIGSIVVLAVGLLAFWAGRQSIDVDVSDRSQPPTQTNSGSRLIESGYWRLANWMELGPGQSNNPNPGNCAATGFSQTSGHIEPTYECVERPVDPVQQDEEEVETISTEALDRFNVDSKPRAMRVVSSYVQTNASFPYRPTTPGTCRSTRTNRTKDTVRANVDLSSPWAGYSVADNPADQRPEFIGDYDYVISENCGDWVLDLETLADDYGGAFFYEEPLDRFNVDATDFGIRPVNEINYPSQFRYQPASPDTCRYYLANASYSRQTVDRLFNENAVDGVRGSGFGGSLDLGGWYNYGSPVVIVPRNLGYVFIISEGCGDWTRDWVLPRSPRPPPDNNQIFDHPYWTNDSTQ